MSKGEDRIVDLLNKQDQEIKRLKLVVSKVIDAIIDDARIQLNEEFLLFSDTFISTNDSQSKNAPSLMLVIFECIFTSVNFLHP